VASSAKPPISEKNLDVIFKECVVLAKKLNKEEFSADLQKSASDLECFLELFFEIYRRKDQAEIKTINKILSYSKQEPLAQKLLTSPKEFINPLRDKVILLLKQIGEGQ